MGALAASLGGLPTVTMPAAAGVTTDAIEVLRGKMPSPAFSEWDRVVVIVATLIPCSWVHGQYAECAECGPPTADGYDSRPAYLAERLEEARRLLGGLRVRPRPWWRRWF